MDITKQEKVKNFVNNQVYVCQSMLIEELLKKDFVSYDDIENLYLTDEQLKANGYDDIEQARDRGEDTQEIFEWWVVSDYLLKRLEDEGEPILKTDFGDWWGRTCTGQSIYLDGVIEKIRDRPEDMVFH